MASEQIEWFTSKLGSIHQVLEVSSDIGFIVEEFRADIHKIGKAQIDDILKTPAMKIPIYRLGYYFAVRIAALSRIAQNARRPEQAPA